MSNRIVLHRLGRHGNLNSLEPSRGVKDIVVKNRVKRRLVTDFGMIPNQLPPDYSLFADGVKIDAIRLTHAHQDHVGLVPALVPFMKREARVFATRPTAAMLKNIFADSLQIGKINDERQPFTEEQYHEILNRLVIIERPGEMEIFPGIVDYVHPEGHIRGACSFTTKIFGRIVHYSGDRCSHHQPSVLGAELLPPAWWPDIIAGSDCTYGADLSSNLRTRDEEMAKAAKFGLKTVSSGAPVFYPSFGIGRGGDIAYELQQHNLSDVGRIFLDGACREFTKITQSPDGYWCNRDRQLDIKNVRFVENRRYREKVLAYGKVAIVATPGMGGPGGIGTWWRRYIMPNPDAAMIFTGYVAPGTDGDKIITEAAKRDVGGPIPHLAFKVTDFDGRKYMETLPLRCQVMQFRAGGHNPQADIVKWFRAYSPEVAVLTHGSRAALASVEQALRGDIKRIVRADLEPTIEIEL